MTIEPKLFFWGIIIIALILIFNEKQIQLGGGYAAEGMPCDVRENSPCKAGLVCFGKEGRGVCIYPKTDQFGFE